MEDSTKKGNHFQPFANERMATMPSFREITDRLSKLTQVDVITTSESEQALKIGPHKLDTYELLNRSDVKVLARTTIGLDGDIAVRFPQETDPAKINREIIKLHSKNVESHLKLWKEMVQTITGVLEELVNYSTRYVNPIGDDKNIIGNVFQDGFEIHVPSMEKGKRYSFEYDYSRYEAVMNDKGELELYNYYVS